MWNARVLWPRGARFLFNTYRGWADLVVRGSKSAALFSKEGVTQGDPLSMFIFAVGSLPLIWSLNSIKEVTQVWYADDASSVGSFDALKEWFDLIKRMVPALDTFQNP